ncbi:glucokinase [Saccharopolyspora kobensis]|uniref:Glucokinase n=1 Tax=Saccharopolyspora kobensis TaxID=146035 RepID=A0A1H6A3U9_9PSEU|nr:ROK family protein [Saccharopolyspora kobensis]SEG42647.1 glucokinase [Saccharopolyspora kobensis]SFE18239.1 glucokinase [Saccharopolyspora kobensis]
MTEHLPVIGIDVGGTGTKAVLADASGAVLAQRHRPTPPRAERVLELACSLVAELSEDAAPAAVGLVVPGVVDESRGVAVFSANLGWSDVPFRALLAERLGLPVAFGHDVRAGALAEHRLGAARGTADAVFLPVGTGISAAHVQNGRVHSGGGYAGEIGQVPVAGGRLEAVASAAAISRRYQERTADPVAGAAEVAQRVAAGDAIATGVWEEAVDALGGALIWLTALLAPEVVVVGGGLSQAGPLLFDPLSRRLEADWPLARAPRLVPAELGDRAGSLGAALLAADLAATKINRTEMG